MQLAFRRVSLSDPVLDRSSPVPLYFQVAQHLEAAIECGDLQVGDRLENEIALAERWGLSRPTMRQAIGDLVNKGLLVRRRGVGTQVVSRRVQRQVQLTSLFEDLQASDQQPTTEVLTLETVPADDTVAERLAVPPRTTVVHLKRLRRARGVPLAILGNWLPLAVGGSLDRESLERHGLYECMRAGGTRVRSAQQRIGARAASASEARLLGARRGAPLLTMERVAFDAQGHPVEWGAHVYDSRTYSFTIALKSD
jgi:DNA-binding GntR family transcriptional regulator